MGYARGKKGDAKGITYYLGKDKPRKKKPKPSKPKKAEKHAEIDVPENQDGKPKKIRINISEYEAARPKIILLLSEGVIYYNEMEKQFMKRWKIKIQRQTLSKYVQYMHRERQSVQQVDSVIEHVVQTQVKIITTMTKKYDEALKDKEMNPNRLADIAIKLMSVIKTYQQTLQNYGIMPAEIAQIEHDVSERSFASIIKAADTAVRKRELQIDKEKSDKTTK